MPLCPSCQKSKLVRCKILRVTDTNYGREYVACSACSSRWFLDDPNRPLGLVSEKPRQSFWKKLATIGSPHNVPDADGILHAATYVFPPPHEYPSLIVPLPKPDRRSLLNPPVSPATGSSDLDLPPPPPPPEPELDPLPPADPVVLPERALVEPAEATHQPEPPAEQAPPSETPAETAQAQELAKELSQVAEEPAPPAQEPPSAAVEEPSKPAEEPEPSKPAEEPSPAAQEPSSATEKPASAAEKPASVVEKPASVAEQPSSAAGKEPEPEPNPDQATPAPKTPRESVKEKSRPASILDPEEQARFDLLRRIASSPGTPFPQHNSEADPYPHSRPASIRSGRYSLSLPPKTPSSPISPEEQHLRETLLRVVATSRSPTPHVYTSLLSPKTEPHEAISSSSPVDDREVAAYAQRIAARLDVAIQKSPFISQQTPKTLRTDKATDSPRFSEPRTPASRHSTVRSSGHRSNSHANSPHQSIAKTITGAPRSDKPTEVSRARSTHQTPRASSYRDDEVALPGAFPTPPPAPLIADAASKRSSRRPSPYSTSLKSAATSPSLPTVKSPFISQQTPKTLRTDSNHGGRTPKRVSITSDTASANRSPLWG
ncbi:hypothetical protein VP01_462g4 [Puccinia sorghi]|uniref:Uncharacterized protein n=1 Tax=Puccinia sorghi TaxID=27349 RepID=A0A0L6UQC8_9BASI|nr:hypothetical protein VP01_462g4 [Puccinia sorghi]